MLGLLDSYYCAAGSYLMSSLTANSILAIGAYSEHLSMLSLVRKVIRVYCLAEKPTKLIEMMELSTVC